MGTTQYENRRQNKTTGAAAQRRRVQECGGALLFLLRLSRDALQQQQASKSFAKFAPPHIAEIGEMPTRPHPTD